MPAIEISEHATDMMRERDIPEEWLWRTLDAPDRTENGVDENTHYIKAIPERQGHFLRVIVNERVTPQRVVTLFFDRRLRRER
jgi:hypothetical protein